MTFISRILGLVRDMVIARFYSAGIEADAFFVAFRIPNFLRRLFAEGAFSVAFVPVLTEYKKTKSPEETRQLLDTVSGTLGGILLIVSILGVLGAPWLVYVFAAGFADEPEKLALTASLLAITFPYVLLISLTALAGGVLNTWKQFAVPAFTPVLLNVSLISCAIWLSPRLEQPVEALAWGVFIAGLAQLAFQLPFLHRLGLLPKPRFDWRDSGVQKVVKLMIPGLFGSSVAQINLLFDTFIASFLVTGSVSWLYYSDRLLEFPLGVFGVALATVVLPHLSENHFHQGTATFKRTLSWAVHLAWLIALPAMMGLLLLAQPILATLFEYGKFSAFDSHMSSLSLMAYATGLPAFILIKVLANAYYARQDTKTPVRIGIQAMVLNMGLNAAFVGALYWLEFSALHVGLALATSASAWFNAGRLYAGLRGEALLNWQAWLGWPVWRIVIATLAMSALLAFWPGANSWSDWLWWQRLLNLGLMVGAAIGLYLAVMLALGLRKRHLQWSGEIDQ